MKKQVNHGLVWSFVVIFIVLVLDQVLKIWVKTSMTLGQEIPVIGHWFNLLFIENNGMAFGWMGGGGFLKLALSLFRIVAIVALFWVLVRLSKKDTKFGVLFGIALITASTACSMDVSSARAPILKSRPCSPTVVVMPAGCMGAWSTCSIFRLLTWREKTPRGCPSSSSVPTGISSSSAPFSTLPTRPSPLACSTC